MTVLAKISENDIILGGFQWSKNHYFKLVAKSQCMLYYLVLWVIVCNLGTNKSVKYGMVFC